MTQNCNKGGQEKQCTGEAVRHEMAERDAGVSNTQLPRRLCLQCHFKD